MQTWRAGCDRATAGGGARGVSRRGRGEEDDERWTRRRSGRGALGRAGRGRGGRDGERLEQAGRPAGVRAARAARAKRWREGKGELAKIVAARPRSDPSPTLTAGRNAGERTGAEQARPHHTGARGVRPFRSSLSRSHGSHPRFGAWTGLGLRCTIHASLIRASHGGALCLSSRRRRRDRGTAAA